MGNSGKSLAGLALAGLLGLGLSANGAADEPATYELHSFRNLAYQDGPDADPVRHRLDVHVPKGHKDFPVVFFVHGGAWVKGNKDHLGVYTLLARCFTRYGIGMVSTNYRLSPGVKHPEHIKDVAKAFAWTHKNIGTYGGRPSELFVVGHSAGGHLVALLATDDSYLRAEGLTLAAIKGALPISGVYDVPADKVFDKVFGEGPETRKLASPLTHARPDGPPFLLLLADTELPACDLPCADRFCKAIQKKNGPAELFMCPHRNHISILWNATYDTDPVMQAILSFVMAQVTLERLGNGPGQAVDTLGNFLARYTGHVGKNGKKMPLALPLEK